MDPRNATLGTVLAVDDTAGNLRVLVESLSSAGLEVLVATDGLAAIETARYARPDLILLDVIMPGIDGYETCARLKQEEATAPIPIIFMTALCETEEKVRAFEVGAVDYITKPFEQAELLARVTTHLTISRLRQDLEKRNRQLEELNQLKNEFMGMAAHDVRNPLASVLACAELIESVVDTVPPERIRLLIGQISASARRINAIITNLLDVNAIDSGQRPLHLADCAFAPLVERVVEQNRLKAAAKEIEIALEPAAGDLAGVVDENAAEQVLDNLISNAVKYSPSGTRVTVRLLAGEDCVAVAVQDQGPGISPDDQTRMYRKFCRLTPKPTAGEPTTGLGLWIVKELTESMKGRIICESAVGKGTTFTVLWPRADGTSASAA